MPERSPNLPKKFRELLVPGKIQHILCSGNLTTRTSLDFLRNIAGDVHVVRGDCDRPETSWPDEKVVRIGNLSIGMIHGHQVFPNNCNKALEAVRRSLQVDILVHGSTHEQKVEEIDGILYINPGSLTGAPTASGDKRQPAFALLDINGSACTLYRYKLGDNDKVDVQPLEFKKRSVAA